MALTRLKQLREEAVLTVHELAEASGVSDDTISKIENGQRVARPNTLRKFARALNVSPQELRRPAKTEELAGAGKAEAPREAGPADEARIEQPSLGIGLQWAADTEYEATVAAVKKMYRKHHKLLHSVKPAAAWPEEERREVLADVVAAYNVLKAVGVSEAERPEGVWMREAMILAASRIIDALRTTREAREEEGEVSLPVVDLEEARERLRAAS
jgi:transcriptional regulator with XRE-family HTH domain